MKNINQTMLLTTLTELKISDSSKSKFVKTFSNKLIFFIDNYRFKKDLIKRTLSLIFDNNVVDINTINVKSDNSKKLIVAFKDKFDIVAFLKENVNKFIEKYIEHEQL